MNVKKRHVAQLVGCLYIVRKGGGSRLATTVFFSNSDMSELCERWFEAHKGHIYFARTFSSGNWLGKLPKFGVKFAD